MRLIPDNLNKPVDFAQIERKLQAESLCVVQRIKSERPDLPEMSPFVLKQLEKHAIKQLAQLLEPSLLGTFRVKRWGKYATELKSKSALEIKNFFEQKLRVRLGLVEQRTKPRVLVGLVAAIARQRPKRYSDVEFSLVVNNYSEQANQSRI